MRYILLIVCLVFSSVKVNAEETVGNLYARSAVLMDADSGRILFGKNEDDVKAMASTTKIMTCILALEYGDLQGVVAFSDLAVSQPKVHLGASEGTQFYLKDLLYSLMLESHNDSAIAVAEATSGSVEAFAELMNRKAEELGCKQTHFVTPNGLDGEDAEGKHCTTSAELAKIMSYCIMDSPQKDTFLEITQCRSYSFADVSGTTTYSCQNHNAFLEMMDGALSGKTGYTAKAGYCYVGALQKDGKTFVVTLLGCGWPNHKNYKWQDTRKLMEYALEHYEYRDILYPEEYEEIYIKNGAKANGALHEAGQLSVEVEGNPVAWQMLLHENDKIEGKLCLNEKREAPIRSGEQVGTYEWYLNGEKIRCDILVAKENIQERDMRYYFGMICRWYCMRAKTQVS